MLVNCCLDLHIKKLLLSVQAYITQPILKQYVCKYLALRGEPEIEAEYLWCLSLCLFLNMTLFRCFFLQYPDVSVLNLDISKYREKCDRCAMTEELLALLTTLRAFYSVSLLVCACVVQLFSAA